MGNTQKTSPMSAVERHYRRQFGPGPDVHDVISEAGGRRRHVNGAGRADDDLGEAVENLSRGGLVRFMAARIAVADAEDSAWTRHLKMHFVVGGGTKVS